MVWIIGLLGGCLMPLAAVPNRGSIAAAGSDVLLRSKPFAAKVRLEFIRKIGARKAPADKGKTFVKPPGPLQGSDAFGVLPLNHAA